MLLVGMCAAVRNSRERKSTTARGRDVRDDADLDAENAGVAAFGDLPGTLEQVVDVVGRRDSPGGGSGTGTRRRVKCHLLLPMPAKR